MSVRSGPWAAWIPSAVEPWDRRRVVHLHRRAAFGARPAEQSRDLADGPDVAVARLLAGTARGSGDSERDAQASAEFEARSRQLLDTALQSDDVARLQAWWLHRMVAGPDPLGEKLALLWHDHFATSSAKVHRIEWMAQQNATLRRCARAKFGDLLDAMVRDPALLWWLDAPANVKGHPNENLARELMELFTLGVGHYVERDVREMARALSGWTLKKGRALLDRAQHDDGEKELFGARGRFAATDLAALLLAHPATAERLAWRLCGLLLGEGVADATARGELAARLRATSLDVGDAVDTVLRSRLFWSDANLGTRVAGPVELVATVARTLELDLQGVSSFHLADWARRMGQELFLPPNVGGWPGGRTWLDTQGWLQRANFAAAVAHGRLCPTARDWTRWCDATGGDAGSVEAHVAGILLGSARRERPRDDREADTAVTATLAELLSSPEAQLT